MGMLDSFNSIVEALFVAEGEVLSVNISFDFGTRTGIRTPDRFEEGSYCKVEIATTRGLRPYTDGMLFFHSSLLSM